MAMNGSQVRVVDPILTEHARGYTNADFVGEALFPEVEMPTRAAKRIEFDRSSFRRRRTRRAPGAPIAALEFGYEGKAVNLHQEALSHSRRSLGLHAHHQIASDVAVTLGRFTICALLARRPSKPAQSIFSNDLQQVAVDTVLAVIAMEKEIQRAEVARNAASYAVTNKSALVGDSKWSDPDSNPKEQVFDAKEVIRKRIGRRPNTLVLAGGLNSALGKHPKLLDHFKFTNSASITLAMMAAYFDVDTVVSGDGIYDQADGTTVDIWGNDAILAWVAPKGQRQMPLPSYGYTYQLRGHPLVEPARWDGDIRSWKNDVLDEFSAELVGADAGFLFQGAL